MVIGFIYKIYDNTNGNVYYGSTKDTLCRRMSGHRTHYKVWSDGKRKTGCKSFDIIKNGDYAYSLVEQVEYEDKLVLQQRERWYIENNECVNKNVPARTLKETKKAYYENNKDIISEQSKAYYENNKDKMNEQSKAYNGANKERIKEQQKAYWEANKEKKNAKRRERYAKKKAEKNEMNV